ncbi:MAG TPA: DNA mismatch repair protein MutL, partial [Polyangiaceae bacterium]|nr:DNA mismatch repair protein MutL [Polyangiaceae bacterium]
AVCDALYQVLASQLGRGFALPSTLRRPTSASAAPSAPPSEPPAPSQREYSGPELPAPARESNAAEPAPARVESPRTAWSRAQLPSASTNAFSPAPESSPAPLRDVELQAAGAASRAPAGSEPEPVAPLDAAAERRDERGPGSGEHVEWAALDFVGQVQNTFLICEGPTGLFIIDQHAAAERVTFDCIRREYQARSVTSQVLLFPVEVQLGAEEAEFLEAHATEFGELGMDVRLRSAQWVSVHGVPRLLERSSPERLLRELLAETMRQGGRGFSGAVDLALATLACHSSLRAGDVVAPAEARALLRALDGVDFAGHCPHGRPIVSFTPWSELLRKVGRR